MVKRICLIFLSAILVCVNCADRGKNEVTFAIGGAPNEIDFWEQLILQFEREKGIQINLLRQPTDTDQRRQGLVIPLQSQKSDPDIFLMDVAWLAQFAASGWLEPLDDCVESGEIEIDRFFDKVVNSTDKYHGLLIALPVYIDGGLLYFRKDLFEKYGITRPPETWAELIDYSIKIQADMRKADPGFYGFVWQGAQYEGLICNFLEFAASNNGGIRFADGKILLSSPENVEALNLMNELIHRHKISPPNTFTEMKEEEVRSFFQRGKALFERNWPYAWSLHQADNSNVQGKVGISPLPHFESGTSASTLGGWHIGISGFSDKKAEAWEFLKFILSYDIQKKLALGLGWNPGRKDIYTDNEVLQRMPHFSDLRGVFENAVSRPNVPYYTRISEVLQRYLNAALADELTAEEALLKAEEEAQKVVERYEGN